MAEKKNIEVSISLSVHNIFCYNIRNVRSEIKNVNYTTRQRQSKVGILGD